MPWYRSSFLLVALSVAACSGSSTVTPTPPPPTTLTVDHVVIDNGDFTLNVVETRQLQVRPLTAAGELVTTATVSFATTAAAIATVSSNGMVSAIAPGVATITATSAGKTASIRVTVVLTPAASISVALQRQVIKTNDTTRIVATLRDASNAILTGRTVTWRSGDSSVVLVGPTGLIFGLRPGGPVTISGSVDGLTASLSSSATISIFALPLALCGAFLALYISGQNLTIFTALGILMVLVTILITPALVASVHIIPDTVVVSPDSSLQFRVEVTDEFGGVVEHPQVIWASVAAQVARVSPTGLVTGVQLGDVLILATVNGVTGQSLVHVAVPEVAKFHISVDNNLRYTLTITENGVGIAQAAPNSITTIDRPLTAHAVIGWILMRPGGRGENMSGALPDIINPTGTIPMTVTNVLADGRVYFTPVLRSFNGSKNPINFPIRESASLCLCAVSSDDAFSRDYGYWLLVPTSVMEIFGPLDGSMTGPKIVVPVLPADVDPFTGVWRYNLLITP